MAGDGSAKLTSEVEKFAASIAKSMWRMAKRTAGASTVTSQGEGISDARGVFTLQADNDAGYHARVSQSEDHRAKHVRSLPQFLSALRAELEEDDPDAQVRK